MIKRFSLLLILLLPFLLTQYSCKTGKEVATSNAKTENTYRPLEKSLLWRIEGNGLTKHSFLFGTIHMIDADDYFLPENTLTAIDQSDKMVFEIDMNEMNDMSAMMGLMSKAFMSDNLALKDLLTAEDYNLVDEHFKKAGLPLMMLERIKPMFLTVFASGDMDPNGIQNGSIKSYEMEFMEIANNANKPTGGLETIEFQMSVFDSIPYKAQADMLVDAIKQQDTGSDEFEKTVQLYLNQDIDGMINMMSEEGQDISQFEDILLTKRNQAWIDRMTANMVESPTFFAVGAGHLAGPNGVIHLLRKEGYTLSPLSISKK